VFFYAALSETAGIETASGTGAGLRGEFGSHASRPRSGLRLQAQPSPIQLTIIAAGDFFLQAC